ncbi:MAG: ATP-binding cassette domain-containing protein [Candidatus Omnitrophica bacterium]|nr:ATP-binding cassette domain-containing protein [Candidatus Omnitrophota bacterium]
MKKAHVVAPDAPVRVRVESISKRFGTLTAIEGVSFEVRQGEVLGFLGPNGAGKTTTVRILTGFFPPSEGTVWIDGRALFESPKEIKRQIGYLPEVVPLYTDMKVSEFLDFAAAAKGVPRKFKKTKLKEIVNRCGLETVQNRLVGQLSKGFRQRVGLAQALVGDPKVLILDEPTSGLDPKQIIEIRGLIRELGRERTLILSSHILPEVSMVCDRILIMNKGRVVASGTSEELEASLKDTQEIYIVMGERHRKDEALGFLRALVGVEKVSVIDERSDQVSLSLTVSKNQDLRPAISRLFVSREIPLLEIRSGRLSLEEIFLKIVVSEAALQEDKAKPEGEKTEPEKGTGAS